MELSNRLPADQWIRDRREYRSIQSSGKVFRQPHLTLLYLPGPISSPRFGITVSRKVGNAVTRNRVKRWIREVIRKRWRDIQDGWSVVVIARPSASSAGLVVIESEFSGFSSWLSRRKP